MVAVACFCQRQGQLVKLLPKSMTRYLKHPCEHKYSTPILYLSPATTDKTDAYEITVVNTTCWLIHFTKRVSFEKDGGRSNLRCAPPVVSNFWKKRIFQKDFLQASKPRRGRELTKDRQYIHMYVRLCKFCQSPSTWDPLTGTKFEALISSFQNKQIKT